MAVETERPHVACGVLVLALLVKQGVLLSPVMHSSRRTSPAAYPHRPPLLADRVAATLPVTVGMSANSPHGGEHLDVFTRERRWCSVNGVRQFEHGISA